MDTQENALHRPGSSTMFFPVNYPPGIGWENEPESKDKICPHFELICQAAALLGIERETLLEKDDFCGFWNLVDFRDTAPDGPTTQCERVAYDLGELIRHAEPAAKKPLIPNHNGHFFLVINCPATALDGKLWELGERLRGQKPLLDLTIRLIALRPGEFQAHESRRIIRAAKAILRDLIRKTMGPKRSYSAICNTVLQGKPIIRTGCKLYPEELLPRF